MFDETGRPQFFVQIWVQLWPVPRDKISHSKMFLCRSASIQHRNSEKQRAKCTIAGRPPLYTEGQEHEGVVCLKRSTFLLYRVSHSGSMYLCMSCCNNLRTSPRRTRQR